MFVKNYLFVKYLIIFSSWKKQNQNTEYKKKKKLGKNLNVETFSSLDKWANPLKNILSKFVHSYCNLASLHNDRQKCTILTKSNLNM